MSLSGSGSDGSGLKVAYILKMFPRLSETFVMNELQEMERQGAEVSVYSLMYPNEGRFHGRLMDLRLAAEYFPSERLETTWSDVREIPRSLATSFARWDEAWDFLRRHGIQKDLDLMMRAALIAARVRQQGIQHIHAHFATVATHVAALVSMFTGVPFSFTAHAKDIFRETVNRPLFSELAGRASFCVTVSDFNRDFIVANMPGIHPGKIIRLHNGIDLDFFAPAPAGRPYDIPHIVSVGRLVPKKGFSGLLRALRLCRQSGLDLRATIVGDGEELPLLIALREELDLHDRVEFAGSLPLEQVRELYAKATMVALACVPDEDGNMDALPTTLLEALAMDIPIVSTRLTGIPEIVGEEAGLLVEPRDDAALARAIAEMWERIRDGRVETGSRRARCERLFDRRKSVATLRGMLERSAVGEGVA